MYHIIVGICASAVFFLLYEYSKKKVLVLTWWQWLLTILAILYGVFVLEVIYGFLLENSGRAALLNGGITGLVAIIFGVLLARFVFLKKAK